MGAVLQGISDECILTYLLSCREVSTIMRYLGAYPTEKDIIKKILPEVRVWTIGDFTFT